MDGLFYHRLEDASILRPLPGGPLNDCTLGWPPPPPPQQPHVFWQNLPLTINWSLHLPQSFCCLHEYPPGAGVSPQEPEGEPEGDGAGEGEGEGVAADEDWQRPHVSAQKLFCLK